MKLVSKVTEIYCIADDFAKNIIQNWTKPLFLSQTPLPIVQNIAREKGEWVMLKWSQFFFCSTAITFRNFKHFYLFYVCRELKKRVSQSTLIYTLRWAYASCCNTPLAISQTGINGRVYRNNLYRFYTYSSVRK